MALTRVSNNMLPASVSVTNVTATNVKATNLQDTSGNMAVDIAKAATTTPQGSARYTRQIFTQVYTGSFSASTSWTLGFTFADIGTFKAGSLVKMTYMIPSRNDSTSWGGTYIEPQIRFNSGTWQSLGSCGYDGGTMHNNSADIASYHNTLLVNPGQTSDFTVGFRFYFKSYDGTTTINGSNDLNTVSGTATIMSGDNGTQHYSHIIVEEMAIMRGAA
jgi:hypothetical protein